MNEEKGIMVTTLEPLILGHFNCGRLGTRQKSYHRNTLQVWMSLLIIKNLQVKKKAQSF